MDDLCLRIKALEAAVAVSLQKGDADGQTVLRRANAFYNFLRGKA